MVIKHYLKIRSLRRKVFQITGLMALLLASWSAMAAKIDVDVDRNPVEVDESFAVTFTAHGSVDGDPDFGPIKKFFDITGGRGKTSSIQIINGTVSRETQWTLNLMPKTPGDLWIPSIAFGSDTSPKVPIKVTAARQHPTDKGNDVLYLETEVDNKTAYVQSQIILTVRVYQAINLLNASLSELSLSDSDAIVEKMDKDKRYNKNINGRSYQVYEKRYIIMPQKSGTLTINPERLQAQYVDGRRALRTRMLKSDPINIEVKPEPALQALQNKPWLPAKQMQIKEQWPQEPPKFKVGDPVTRTITITADGLSSSQLPQIKMGDVPGIKQYPDQPVKKDQKTDTGIIGTRQEKIALIPTKAGNYVIPAIEIPWWNTEKNSLEYLRLPKREIRVLPGAQTAQQNTGGAMQNGQSAQSLAANPQSADNSSRAVTAGGLESRSTKHSIWMWVSLVAFLGWGVTGLAWWRAGRAAGGKTQANKITAQVNRSGAKQCVQRLKTACAENNAQTAKNALLQWGKRVWSNPSPTNLNDLARCSGGELGEQLLKLNEILYSNSRSQWNGDALWQAFNRYESKPQREKQSSDDGLLPLYKTIAN